MIRGVYITLMVLSLALCAACLALWPYCYWYTDLLRTRDAYSATEIGSSGCTFHFSRWDAPQALALADVGAWHVQWTTSTSIWGRFEVTTTGRCVGMEVPYWVLAAFFAALAALLRSDAAAVRWIQRQRRRMAGLCPTCGYDLRASPERCPECGTPRPNSGQAGGAVPGPLSEGSQAK